MPSVFSRIIDGELPCYEIYQNDYVIAFLSIRPHTLGHTLIVPKVEVDKIYDVDDIYYSALFDAAKLLAPAIESATSCLRVGYMSVGLEVPHTHLHLIPIHHSGDMDHHHAHEEAAEQMNAIAQKIRDHLQSS